MKFVASLAATLLFLGVAHALNCYTCDSDQQVQHDDCIDPFHKPQQHQDLSCSQSFNQAFSGSYKSPENFNDNQDSCVKVVYFDPVTHQKQRVVRGCASGFDNVCTFLGGNLPNVKCHSCKKNLCNGATSLSALSASIVALCSVLMALKM